MAPDTQQLYAQVASLKRQSAAASHLIRVLTSYKSALSGAWSGREVRPVVKEVEAQLRDCQKLRDELDALCRDLLQAAEEAQQEPLPQKGN